MDSTQIWLVLKLKKEKRLEENEAVSVPGRSFGGKVLENFGKREGIKREGGRNLQGCFDPAQIPSQGSASPKLLLHPELLHGRQVK